MVDLSKYQANILAAKEKVYNAPVEDHSGLFLDHLLLSGFKNLGHIEHGQITRICDADDKGTKKSGWYIYYQNETVSVGVYGSWKNPDEKQVWYSKEEKNLSLNERNEVFGQIKQAQERQQLARRKLNQEAAENAVKLIADLPLTTEENAYLKRKQVKTCPDLRQKGENLIIPVYYDGHITSIQTIKPDGEKRFMTGGKTKGGYFVIDGNDSIVYIAEGYATGASIAEATGNKVYISFSAHNLFETWMTIKDKYGKIIICGDNDKTCLAKCQQIACESIFPPAMHNDFNDWWVVDRNKMTEFFHMKPSKIEKKEVYADHVFHPTGVIAQIIDYYNATARRDQPLFAIQCAIATCSVILGRNFVTNFENRTSLFLMNLAKSATGKEHAKRVCEKILEATNNDHLISGDGYTSASAVISACQEKPRHITIIDEFAKYLQASKNAQSGGHMAEANSALMQAINRLDGTLRAKNRASIGMTIAQKKDVQNQHAVCPAITLMAMSTPENFFNTIGVDAIKDGFINRFIVCVSDTKRTISKRKEPMEVPESIIDWELQIKIRRGTSDESPIVKPNATIIPFSLECHAIQDEYEQYCIDIADMAEQYGMSEISGRSHEMSLKLALIIALSENPNVEEVKAEHMQQAVNWVKYNLDRLVKELKINISSSDYEATKKEILKALRACGGMAKSDMFKRPPFSKYEGKILENVLSELSEAELITKEIEEKEGAGRRKTIWKAI